MIKNIKSITSIPIIRKDRIIEASCSPASQAGHSLADPRCSFESQVPGSRSQWLYWISLVVHLLDIPGLKRLLKCKDPSNFKKFTPTWYFLSRAHLSKQTPSQLCDGDIDEVGVVDHLILDSCHHAMQTVLQIVTYCCNCQCTAELTIFARTVHIRQNCSNT